MAVDRFLFASEEDRKKFNWGDKTDPQLIAKIDSKHPVFCFKFADTNSINYSFLQTHFDKNDFNIFIKKLKFISSQTIHYLSCQAERHHHFQIRGIATGNIKKLIKELAGEIKLNDSQMPIVGHFALYTSKNGADRDSKRKSPRIHFFVGNHAEFHILFYDPFHEIHRNKQSSENG